MIKLSRVFAPRKPAATRGAEGAIVMKAPMEAMLVANNEELTKCLAGMWNGRDDMRPASLRNATTEPVKVIPPIRTR